MRFLLSVMLFSVLGFSATAWAAPPLPKQVHCEIAGWESPHDLKYLADLTARVCRPDPTGRCGMGDTLARLGRYGYIAQRKSFPCNDKLMDGTIVRCMARLNDPQFEVSLLLDSGRGNIYLWDKATGTVHRSEASNWEGGVNQRVSVGIEDWRGGIFGNPKLYKVNATCFATVHDFPTP